MAITKLSHVKERKSGNPNAGLYNCIDYILNPDKTEERYIGVQWFNCQDKNLSFL